MKYRVEITRNAEKQIKKIPESYQKLIFDRFDELAENPRPAGTKKIGDNLFRNRVGDYRIVYEVLDDVLSVTVTRVKHRKDVYRKR